MARNKLLKLFLNKMVDLDFSTKKPSKYLLDEVKKALQSIKGYGSIEVIIQDYKVVQITERNIRKTNGNSVVINNIEQKRA